MKIKTLLKFTGSHVPYRSANAAETVQDRNKVTMGNSNMCSAKFRHDQL